MLSAHGSKLLQTRQREQLILGTRQRLLPQQIGPAIDKPLVGTVCPVRRAHIHGLARLFFAVRWKNHAWRQKRRDDAQHERLRRSRDHAPLAVHDQRNMAPCQIKRHLWRVELDCD
ncbi:hypothetical protein G6F64_014797 [Rhizopus arrhizus]|uniref:Uncharacterized protein n=1 Tax=Rhizopus oryzae TaxID=64495 RepID=A0A9P6WSR3_RHIOR|nr:hypothetical protein G6F64_014797 [Rhizopus arrhizus]